MKRHSNRLLWAARIGVLALAAAFIAVGLTKGEHVLVFEKAVKICLECIGIG